MLAASRSDRVSRRLAARPASASSSWARSRRTSASAVRVAAAAAATASSRAACASSARLLGGTQHTACLAQPLAQHLVVGLRALELLAVLGAYGTELGLQRCHLRGQAGVLGVGLLVALLVLAAGSRRPRRRRTPSPRPWPARRERRCRPGRPQRPARPRPAPPRARGTRRRRARPRSAAPPSRARRAGAKPATLRRDGGIGVTDGRTAETSATTRRRSRSGRAAGSVTERPVIRRPGRRTCPPRRDPRPRWRRCVRTSGRRPTRPPRSAPSPPRPGGRPRGRSASTPSYDGCG